MSDLDIELRRFELLTDRLAVGEALTADESAFVARMMHEHPVCRLEAELLDELAELDAPPTEQTRALVDAALAHVASPAAKPDARERTLRAQRKARASKLRWLSAGVAAAAAAALILGMRPTPQPRVHAPGEPAARIELAYLSGDVRVDGQAAVSGARLLREGSVLSVKSGGACIAMDPEINVCASAGTELKLTRMDSSSRRLDLLAGKVAVQLAPQPDGTRFSIVSDGVWSTAIGTAFTVQRDPELGVQTTVLHGKVRVGKTGSEQVVSAHQRARVQHGSAKVLAVSRGDESPDWAMLGPTKLWNAQVSATLELTGLPANADALLDGQAIGIAPIATLIPVGEHRLDVRIAGAIVWSRQLTVHAGDRAEISLAGVDLTAQTEAKVLDVTADSQRSSELRSARGRQRAQATQSAQSAVAMLSEARQLLRRGELSEAAAQYNALLAAHPHSAESRIGLLSLAELQLEHLGQPSAALQNAERYLADGGGSLAPEAEETRVRALRALGRTHDERKAIEAFLKAHPESLRSSTLRRRLEQLDSRNANAAAPGSDDGEAEAR